MCSHLDHAKSHTITIAVVVKFNVNAEGIASLQLLQALLQCLRLVDQVDRRISGKGQMSNGLAGKNKVREGWLFFVNRSLLKVKANGQRFLLEVEKTRCIIFWYKIKINITPVVSAQV